MEGLITRSQNVEHCRHSFDLLPVAPCAPWRNLYGSRKPPPPGGVETPPGPCRSTPTPRRRPCRARPSPAPRSRTSLEAGLDARVAAGEHRDAARGSARRAGAAAGRRDRCPLSISARAWRRSRAHSRSTSLIASSPSRLAALLELVELLGGVVALSHRHLLDRGQEVVGVEALEQLPQASPAAAAPGRSAPRAGGGGPRRPRAGRRPPSRAPAAIASSGNPSDRSDTIRYRRRTSASP